jgi:hypothetical protein
MPDAISWRGRPNERGSALVAVLLLLLMMTALVAALGVGSQTESVVSRNHNSAARAQAAAEAGLSHAVALAVRYIAEWRTNGFASSFSAVDALLAGPDGLTGDAGSDADNGSLGARNGIAAEEAIPLGERLEIEGGVGVGYEAGIIDDAGDGVVGEDGDPYNDTNQRLVVRATGYGPDGSTAILEALIGPTVLPAIVSEGDIELNGSVKIHSPANPSDGHAIHSNGDVRIAGNGPDVTGLVTATGVFDSDNDSVVGTGSAPRVEIPRVNAADYEATVGNPATSPHRFKLFSDGTLMNIDTGVICHLSNAAANCGVGGWSFSGGEWITTSPTAGTYYVEGDVSITGSPGSANAPLALTLVAEGNIQISGNPRVVPDTEGLLFVTNKDLKITGNFAVVYDELTLLKVQGRVLVREQLELGGNVTLAGQIQVENAGDASSLVTSNKVHGNALVEYGGGLSSDVYRVMGWREVRDAD